MKQITLDDLIGEARSKIDGDLGTIDLVGGQPSLDRILNVWFWAKVGVWLYAVKDRDNDTGPGEETTP